MKKRESMWRPDRMYKEAFEREEVLPDIAKVRAEVATRMARVPLHLFASTAVLAITEGFAQGEAITNVGRISSGFLAFCALRDYLYAHAEADKAHRYEDPEACELALDFQEATSDIDLLAVRQEATMYHEQR